MVSPALCPGQLSYAVSLRGSNLDNLSFSFLTSSTTGSLIAPGKNDHRKAYTSLIVYTIKSIHVVILYLFSQDEPFKYRIL